MAKQATHQDAELMATKQRDIGVAEFFARNRHLLGFDNKTKALMTTIKEAVDNSLDACEEAGILPEVLVEVIDMGNDRFRIVIEDNGPGIVKAQIPKIFAKLLYGSKFHQLKQSRGQQGIGISAAVMYGQITTGRAARITSKTGPNKPANYYELKIDTKQNAPEIVKDDIVEWSKEQGTRFEVDLEASYQKGQRSIDEYLKQTAITNPHATIIYTNPKAEQLIFPRVSEVVPPASEAIKPHPHGVELGVLIDMLKATQSKTLQAFLSSEFSRVSDATAKNICQNSKLDPKLKPEKITRDQAEQIMKGIVQTNIMAPPTDSIAPIGAELLEKGLRKEINAEFYAASTRPPSVYRGNPFIVEVALAYGGAQAGDSQISIMRFANRVPLLYQQGACAVTKGVISTNWKSYGLQQSKNSLPVGPCTVAIHIASVWVPFTSESKEAIAHYTEILKEIRLALQEVGRKLASYVRKKKTVSHELKKREYIQKFLPHLSEALQEILLFDQAKKDEIEEHLGNILEQQRGKVADMSFDPKANKDYDDDFASIGKNEDNADEDDEEDQSTLEKW